MVRRDQEFAEFFATRFERARRIAYSLSGDWLVAEDLAQDAFARIYARWTRIEAETVDGYLRVVVTRLYLNRGRGQRARELATAQPPDRAVDGGLDAGDDRDTLTAALARLPPGQRSVLVLRFAEDLSVEQVAAILRCSNGSVKSQTAKGLAKLRAAYQDITAHQ